MSQARAHFVENYAVPPERLWEAITDHEGMSEWLDVRISVVKGPADGGVGTVRRIHAPLLAIDEEVTYADAPRRLVYRIVRGAPGVRFHRGEVLIEPWGQTGAQLTWDILLESPVPGLASAIAAGLRPAIRGGLGKLRGILAESAPAAERAGG